MIRCSVNSPRVSSPVRRPSHSTRMRSHSVISSGSSLDVTMIPSPLPAEPVDDRVEFRLGADVDAARRVVEQQHARVRSQPAGDDALLLIAAGQARNRRFRAGGLDRQLLASTRRASLPFATGR